MAKVKPMYGNTAPSQGPLMILGVQHKQGGRISGHHLGGVFGFAHIYEKAREGLSPIIYVRGRLGHLDSEVLRESRAKE